MSDSANTFSSLQPLFKESYASGPMATHEKPGKDASAYSKRLGKLMEKPHSSKQYFAHIKRYIKKAKNGAKP